ncbi:LysR family transcriptional regulator [Nocardia brasiliensis]|uniref:LysR family transcriptional regulator n=2 Tax=Nocardia brasiliensis TaxID=37326 RepID=UPI0024582928|nr:LysR family transcriptional regulator [Nocardia brasiliensis]
MHERRTAMLERLELEAFLTLAEELHFGRTANRLGLTTSRISQTIRRLERRIGAALFERNSRKVTLTNVGRQLRDDLRPAYDQINAGIAAASRGNVVPGTLMVGFSGPWCGNLMVTRHHRADPVLRTPRTDGPYRTSLRATRVDIAGRPRRHHTAADSIPQYWMDYYFPRRTPTGRPIPQGPAA